VSLASGSVWLKFGVDRVKTEAVATISSVGDDFVWGFLVGFWPGGQKAGVKKCENHTTLQQREVDFHAQGDMRNKVC